MADRTTDHTTNRRPIPPPPRVGDTRSGGQVESADDDLDAAFADMEPAPQPKAQREDFQAARRHLVDLYAAVSGGKLDHTAFNKRRTDEFAEIAAQAGVRPWTDAIAENRALREALVHEVGQRHRHVDPAADLADLIDSPSFDYESLTGRAAEIEQQRSESARGLLVAAMAQAGIDTSDETFDPVALLQAAANPAPAPQADPTDSPQWRTSNLPVGRPPTLPTRWNVSDLSGSALLEEAATETLRELGI